LLEGGGNAAKLSDGPMSVGDFEQNESKQWGRSDPQKPERNVDEWAAREVKKINTTKLEMDRTKGVKKIGPPLRAQGGAAGRGDQC